MSVNCRDRNGRKARLFGGSVVEAGSVLLMQACMVLIAALFLVHPVLAQNIPGAVTPGRTPDAPIEEPEEDDFEFSFSLDIEGGQSAPPGSEDEEMDFEGLVFDGATVYSAEELAEIWQPYAGESITFAQFYELTAKVGMKYKQDGYETSYAFYPPQEVEDGIFTMKVVEGYIDAVEVQGDLDAEIAIKRLLEPLTKLRPIKTSDIERAALLVNDLAGVRGTVVLGPSPTESAATRLIVKVTHTSYSGSAELNNRGTNLAGKNQGLFSGTANSLFGFGERITVSGSLAEIGSQPKESQSLNVAWELPVRFDGGKFVGTLAASEGEPGGNLDALNIQSSSRSASIGYEWPMKRSRSESLFFKTEFSVLESRTISGADTSAETELSEDSLRTLSFGARYSNNGWLGGLTSGTVSIHQLTGLFGPSTTDSSTVSRADANGGATFVKMTATHLRNVAPGWTALINANAQIARTPLFASDEFGVGGQAVGRGFDSSEITGDNGWSGLVEARYSPSLDGLDDRTRDLVRSFQPYGFFDIGQVHNLETDNTGAQKTLMSAGLGFRANMKYNASVEFQLAKPLTGVVASTGNSRKSRGFLHVRVGF